MTRWSLGDGRHSVKKGLSPGVIEINAMNAAWRSAGARVGETTFREDDTMVRCVLAILLTLALGNTALAGAGWYGMFINQTNEPMVTNPGGNNCWYPDDLGNINTIPANSQTQLYSESKASLTSGCYKTTGYVMGWAISIGGTQIVVGSLNGSDFFHCYVSLSSPYMSTGVDACQIGFGPDPTSTITYTITVSGTPGNYNVYPKILSVGRCEAGATCSDPNR